MDNMDEKLVEVDKQEISVKDFKSVFYQLTAKPDSMTRVFTKDASIEIDDIRLLNDRVVEKLKSHYNDAGFLISVHVKFTNGKMKTFSSWRAFDEHKWYESESINKIVICWEFNAMLPQYTVPQKHTLTVKMTNSMRPEEMINIIFTGNIQELEELDRNFFPVVARVDFIDRVLGDELLNIVSDWMKGLKESSIEKSKTILFLKKNKGKLASILNFITYVVIAVSSIIVMNRYIRTLGIMSIGQTTVDQLICLINAAFACSGVWILSKRLVSSVTDRIYDLLREYGDSCLFDITKGDKTRQEKIKRHEKNNRISLTINLIGTILLNILCSVIANKIF